MRACALGIVLIVTGLAVGCNRIEKPKPPDMSALVAAYEHPSGTLDADAAAALSGSVGDVLSSLEALGAVDLLDDALARFRDSMASEPEAAPQAKIETEGGVIVIEGKGFVEVDRICNGWGAQPAPDPQNGSLKLNVNLSDTGVDPVLWLTAARCLYRVGDAGVRIDAGSRRDVGDVRIYVGDNITIGGLGKSRLLVEIDARGSLSADTGGADVDLHFDFSFDPPAGRFELRIPVDDGDVVASPNADGTIAVRAGNGSFTCDFTTKKCSGEGGDVSF